MWAAAWLFHATNDKSYSDYLNDADTTGGLRTMFSWDDKYAGAQILIGKVCNLNIYIYIYIYIWLKKTLNVNLTLP